MTPIRHRAWARALRTVAAAAVLAGFLLVGGGAAEAWALHPQDTLRAAAGAPMAEGDQVKYYIVGKEPDGEPEFLFSIAQKVLGDGNRFNEIFELNKNRAQPDGGVLTKPTAVEVGWVLQLPTDAEGEDVRFGKLPATPGSVPAPATEPPAASQPQAVNSPTTSTTQDGVTPVLGVGAVALAIGAVGGYVAHRRRSANSAAAAFAGPSTAPDRRAAVSVSPVVAGESGSVTGELGGTDALAEPERCVAVYVPTASVPAAAPVPATATATATAFAPATASPAVARRRNGVRGSAPRPRTAVPRHATTRTFHVVFGDDLVDISLATPGDSTGESSVAWMPVPYDVPEGAGVFLCIGASDAEGCLFLDLAQAPGTVAVGGDLAAAKRLLESLVLQLGVSSALDQVSAVATGTLAAMADGLPGVERAASLGEVAARRVDEAAASLEFIFGTLDSEADHSALSELLRSPGRVVPIVLGEPETAAWTFTVRPVPAPENQEQPAAL